MVTVYYPAFFDQLGEGHKLQIRRGEVKESDLQGLVNPIKKKNVFHLVENSKLNTVNFGMIKVNESAQSVWTTYANEHGESYSQKLVFLSHNRLSQELARLKIAPSTGCKRKTYHWNGMTDEIWRDNTEGQKYGQYKKMSASGTLQVMAYYNKGKLHGRYVEFWENGKIKSDIEYDMGQYHGQYKEFLEDGKLFKSLEYVHGHLVRKAIVGTLVPPRRPMGPGCVVSVAYSEYERNTLGKLHGKQVIVSITETGELLEEVQYWNNGLKMNDWTTSLVQLDGTKKIVKTKFHTSNKYVVKTYGLDGYVKQEEYDKDGKVLHHVEEKKPGQASVTLFKRFGGDVQIFNESGQLIKTESTLVKSTYVKHYDPSTGKLLKRFCRDGSGLTESYCLFDTKEKLIFSLNFLHGRRHGKFMMRKSDGSFLCQGKYCHGLLHGSYREVLSSGEEILGHYEHGVKTGDWTTVKDGKLVSLKEMRHGIVHRGYTVP